MAVLGPGPGLGGEQVLTVHSNVRIENRTSHGLQFVVHMLRGGRGGARATGEPATLAVPGAGPLAPGLQCYLPVAAARCAAPLRTEKQHQIWLLCRPGCHCVWM